MAETKDTRDNTFKQKMLETVKPSIAWSVLGGTLAVAVGLALIFWL